MNNSFRFLSCFIKCIFPYIYGLFGTLKSYFRWRNLCFQKKSWSPGYPGCFSYYVRDKITVTTKASHCFLFTGGFFNAGNTSFFHSLFSLTLDFRVRLFNILALGGTVISLIMIFLIVFPAMFFSSSGYHGGMPAFFVFAIIFTVLMLEKTRALIVSLLELVLYIEM